MGKNLGNSLNLLAVLLSKLTLCFEPSLRAYISIPAGRMPFGSQVRTQSQAVRAGRGS